jgi:hypothetical protein
MGKGVENDESIDVIISSLEECANNLGDIVPMVFERFFALDAGAHELMGHSDQHMQGRMLESVLDLLMSDEHFEPGGYLDWELDNHLDAYNATVDMYEAFFVAIKEVVRIGVGDGWTSREEAAWQSRIEQILSRVRNHGSAHA